MANQKKSEIKYPLVVHLEAVLMVNMEIIHYGKSLGFINKRQLSLVEGEATKLSKGNEIIVAVNDQVA